MSLSSTRLNMKHFCSIERDVNAGSDNGWGNSQPPNWQPHITNGPCRSWSTAGHEAVLGGTETLVVVEDLRMIVPLGTDVTEQDRVASISYRGVVIQPGPLSIRAVLTYDDHLELVLVKVT